jgi:hypothetical protein
MHYFSITEIRLEALKNPIAVEAAFKELCSNDQSFLGSIEKTTKSVEATFIRFSKWANALNNILAVDIHAPTIQNGRII